jgi:hypothetical protein
MAQRWIVCEAAARTAQSRLVLRFIQDRTDEGRRFRMLCVIDEFTRVAWRLRWRDDCGRTMCCSA